MEKFKVICKADCNWVFKKATTKIVTYTSFLGLFKKSKLIAEQKQTNGPDKNEICLVIDIFYLEDGSVNYGLSGYPDGMYNSKYFVRMDEIGNVFFAESKKKDNYEPSTI